MAVFVHTADIHLGSLRGVKTITYSTLLKRYEGYLRSIFAIARKRKAECVVMAGDIFDHKNVRPKVRDVLLRVLLDNEDMPVLIINGNHDLLEEGYTSLHFLTLLQAKRKRLPNVTIAEITPRVVEVKGCWYVLIPFTGDQQRFIKSVKAGVEEALHKGTLINEDFTTTKPPIVVVGHEMVVGCSDDSGWSSKNKGIKLPTDMPDVTYWAMGDIHKRQRLGGLRNAFYPGPPAQHKFNEKPDKGVLLVNTSKPTKPKHIRIKHPDVAPLLQVEADTVEEVRAGLDEAPDGALVNLRVPDAVSDELNAEDTSEAEVVKSSPSPRQRREAAAQATERIASKVRDPLAALPGWLQANKGYSKKQAAAAETIARRL